MPGQVVAPPRRTPFRSGMDGPTHRQVAQFAPVRYAAVTEKPGTDRDILFGYQIFLGRDPENSFVIADGKSNKLRGFLHGLITSAECHGAVLRPLLAARKLPHESTAPGPTDTQIAWLLQLYDADAAFAEGLRLATDWRELWRALARVPDFPSGQASAVAAAPATPGVTAADADQGFVLITVDQPKPAEKLHAGAILAGNGWTIAPRDITRIEVFLNDRLLTHARHGLPRPDVARNFPHYRHVASCGFSFTAALPADLAAPAASLLRIVVTTEDGQSGTKTVAVTVPGKSPPSLPDTATIRLALEDAKVDASGELRLRGYAMSRLPIRSLTVFLGDRALGPAEYGVARPDLETLFTDFADAGDSGFVFACSLAGSPEGPASVRVQATDSAGQQRQAIMPVAIPPACDQPRDAASVAAEAATTHMRMEVDKPLIEADAALAPIRGALTISGWAVAPEGIAHVTIFCDRTDLGRAYLGMRREDIGRLFPDHVDALLSGYAMVVPPGVIPAGIRTIRLTAVSRSGATLDRAFTIKVEPPDSALSGGAIRTTMPRAEIAFGLMLLAQRGYRPHFQVVVRGEDPALLAITRAALQRQAYPDWTMVAVPPASGRRARPKPAPALPDSALPDSALLCVLHAGDELGCDALLEMAIARALDPQADFIYADEQRPDPFFKPAWSPELLLGTNYIGRPWCAPASLAAAAGISPGAYGSTGDYDLVLRLTEAAARIVHVDRLVLKRGPAPDETPDSEAAALAGASRRRALEGQVVSLGQGKWRLQRRIAAPGRISIIMPTCGARGLVRQAIASIRDTTKGRDVEIVVLDNVPARDRKLKTWLRANAEKLLEIPGPFNWSAFNNRGAAAATGATLLFLNDDIEAREAGWLDALLEHTQSLRTGVVGARLLYPDGKVQHAGQFLNETHARHAFRFAGGDDPGPFGLALVARETVSVTGACLAMRRDVFDRLGGFDEAHSVVNNDLDFCLKAQAAGLAVIITPHATLLHHELASRAGLEDAFDTARFDTAWRQTFLRGDPYHGPRLLPDADHFAPEPEPVVAIHVGPAGPDHASIKSILAVKLDHIGDFLTALPALRSLKAHFPNARLSLLAPPATVALAAREPCIDATIEFNFFHAVSGRGQLGVTDEMLQGLRARLEPQDFDMAIDLRMQPETRKILRHTGARFLAGYDREGSFPFLDVALEWEGDTALLAKRQHISERLLQLVAATAEACRAMPRTPPPRTRDAASIPALASLPAAFLAARLVCVHPGVGNAVRQWPAAHYAALIDLLAGEAGLHAILIGGGDEAAVAEDVLRLVSAKDRVVSLVGQVKLDALPGVMQACALFVGNNSGPKHLAASLGVPTLGIHSAVVDAVEWGPLGAASFALRRDMACGPCYLEFATDCPRAMACLTGIRPRDAYAACLRLLAMRP